MIADHTTDRTTDRTLAGLAASAYGAPPTWRAGDVHACLTEMPDATVIAFRGTEPESLADWVRDLEAWPMWVRGLGYCHDGFASGVLAIWPALSAGLYDRGRVILTGHSLGGALAVIAAGMLALNGTPAARLVTFGAPRAGTDKLVGVLRATPARQYRCGDDPVPEVPGFFEHVRPLIEVGSASLDPLRDHEIARYQAAVPA